MADISIDDNDIRALHEALDVIRRQGMRLPSYYTTTTTASDDDARMKARVYSGKGAMTPRKPVVIERSVEISVDPASGEIVEASAIKPKPDRPLSDRIKGTKPKRRDYPVHVATTSKKGHRPIWAIPEDRKPVKSPKGWKLDSMELSENDWARAVFKRGALRRRYTLSEEPGLRKRLWIAPDDFLQHEWTQPKRRSKARHLIGWLIGLGVSVAVGWVINGL